MIPFKEQNTGVRLSYVLLAILLILELSNLLFKYYKNMYYFHVYTLGLLSVAVFVLGWSLHVNKIWVTLLGIISLTLVILAYWIVWN